MPHSRHLSEVFKNFKLDFAEGNDALPETPATNRSLESTEQNGHKAVEIVDSMFRMVKLTITNPPRWKRLFLASAVRYEAALDRLREAAYIACALDDEDELQEIKEKTPEKLWTFWGFYLGMNERSTKRCRPGLIALLPPLSGEPYPGFEVVNNRREAMLARPRNGTAEAILEMQRGETLISIVCPPFQKMKEIDMMALSDALNHAEAGDWQETDKPACGVNFGRSHGDFGGWRPLHFAAANTFAKETCVPAIELLVEAKADALLSDASGHSPLHVAAFRGNVEAAEILLEVGADVEAGDKFGMTALLAASRSRHTELIRRMIKWVLPDENSDPILDTEAERTAQMYSIINGVTMHRRIAEGNLGVAVKLIQKGDGNGDNLASVTFADSMGKHAVHVAAQSVGSDVRVAEIMRALCQIRADVDARDLYGGETALHVAARLGRAPVVRTLLRLKAHPLLPDKRGRTPLMLAAAAPGQVCGCGTTFQGDENFCLDPKCGAKRMERQPPLYDGVPIHKPLPWSDVQDILDWSGIGEIPGSGPKARKVMGPANETVTALFSKSLLDSIPKGKKRRGRGGGDEEEEYDPDEEDEEDQQTEATPSPTATGASFFKSDDDKKKFVTPIELVRARAEAFIALAFDDQNILDEKGNINRGDRVQLFSHVFQRERGAPKTAPLQPNEKRLNALWNSLTAPLSKMELQKALSPRLSQLLHYLLINVGGRRGVTLGAIVTAGIGPRLSILPTWNDIHRTLVSYENLRDRVAELRILCFRGPLPKRQKWVGAVWNRDDYPREPEHIPWGALEYVDEETADVINSRGGKDPPGLEAEEAFKGNNLAPAEQGFKFEVVSNNAPPANRGDQLQIANRLLVDEACGQWAIAEESCSWDRSRAFGEYLLCPLLEELLEALRGNEEAQSGADEHWEFLKYVASEMSILEKYKARPRGAYKEPWSEVKITALNVLSDQLVENLQDMVIEPIFAENDEWRPGGPKANHGQEACLPEADVKWLQKRHTSVAYIELLRCGALKCADDFCEVIIALAAHSTQDTLVECFWRAAFGLLLWGRAQALKRPLETELRRRLRGLGVWLQGPSLRARSEVLLTAAAGAASVGAGTGSGASPRAAAHAEMDSPKRRKGFVPQLSYSPPPPGPLPPHLEKLRLPNRHLPPGISAKVEVPVVKKRFPPAPIPTGFTDVLRAEIICRDEAAMLAALQGLLELQSAPEKLERPQSKDSTASRHQSKESVGFSVGSKESVRSSEETDRAPSASPSAGSPSDATDFCVVRVESDFHKPFGKVFPRCCGILLVCRVGCDKLVRGEKLQQLVEIELIFPTTKRARWVADFVDVDPRDPVLAQPKKVPKKKAKRGAKKLAASSSSVI